LAFYINKQRTQIQKGILIRNLSIKKNKYKTAIQNKINLNFPLGDGGSIIKIKKQQ